jgi:PTH1 family peptidyl-tRNA hydrolase
MPLGTRFAQFRERVARRQAPPAPVDAPVDRPLLVVGLGNPGADYGNTRHNLGVWVVNLLARRHQAQLKRRGRVDGAEVEIEGTRIHLARPRSYMNESGGPVAGELRRLGLQPGHLLVIYDDLDLPVGRTRMRLQGGSGGNNGMKSIIGAVGTTAFARIRIGIDRPYDHGQPVRDPERVARWVLAKPSAEDRRRLDAAIERTVRAVEMAVVEGYDPAMNWLNREPEADAGRDSGASR